MCLVNKGGGAAQSWTWDSPRGACSREGGWISLGELGEGDIGWERLFICPLLECLPLRPSQHMELKGEVWPTTYWYFPFSSFSWLILSFLISFAHPSSEKPSEMWFSWSHKPSMTSHFCVINSDPFRLIVKNLYYLAPTDLILPNTDLPPSEAAVFTVPWIRHSSSCLYDLFLLRSPT